MVGKVRQHEGRGGGKRNNNRSEAGKALHIARKRGRRELHHHVTETTVASFTKRTDLAKIGDGDMSELYYYQSESMYG
jgi:hypothetical protein